MRVDAIKNGIVIDHIEPGCAMKIYDMLSLDKLDCPVAILKNVSSNKMGKKDIIKIDCDIDINLDVLGFISPSITVVIVKDGEVAQKLMHPRNHVEKIYHVKLKGEIEPQKLKMLNSPMQIDGVDIAPVKVTITAQSSSAQATVACEPKYRKIWRRAKALPSVSGSGFLWHNTSVFFGYLIKRASSLNDIALIIFFLIFSLNIECF